MIVIAAVMGAVVLKAVGQVPADTLISVESPAEVTVQKMDGRTVVTVKGSASDELFNYSYSVSPDTVADMPFFNIPFTGSTGFTDDRTVRQLDFFRGCYAGAVIPMSGPSAIKTSWEVGINQIIGCRVRRRGSDFSLGLGIGYRRFGVGKGLVTEKAGDALILSPAPEGATDVSARIESALIQIPLIFTQRICRTFGFSFGVVANFNTYTAASMNYNIGDTKYSKTVKGLHQRLLTPDLILTVGSVNNAGIYVRWSPVKTFKSIYGPAWNSLAVGVSVAF